MEHGAVASNDNRKVYRLTHRQTGIFDPGADDIVCSRVSDVDRNIAIFQVFPQSIQRGADITKNEIKNIQDLNLELKLNGKITQKGNTNKMIFGVKHIVSYLSHFMTLNPGDIITTGTPPGVGMARNPQIFLKPGDEMILNIDNLGSQKQKVISMK